jgi:hypothetical protein
MNRSPYYSPLGRAADMDVGGAADLQTDIMRFMAILALCLVAIFALVQSIPLQPVEIETVSTPIDETSPVQRVEPVAVPTPEPKIDPAPLTRKINPAPFSESAPAPAPKPPAPTPEPEGFTLRFASDSALTRLVARNEIGLYAITPERALRMSMNRGSPSFWPASAPNQYHEMDPATVPYTVITALRRRGTLGLDPNVKWGVTLPPSMRRQLDRYLGAHTGGELVIEATGNLRLEN